MARGLPEPSPSRTSCLESISRAMAESMGISGHVIESPADFERIDWVDMVRRRAPTLLDVRIDREEVPPMVMRLKALGSVKA